MCVFSSAYLKKNKQELIKGELNIAEKAGSSSSSSSGVAFSVHRRWFRSLWVNNYLLLDIIDGSVLKSGVKKKKKHTMQLCSLTSSLPHALNSARGFEMRGQGGEGGGEGGGERSADTDLLLQLQVKEKKTKKKQNPRQQRARRRRPPTPHSSAGAAGLRAPPMPVSMETAPRSKLPHLSWLSASQRRFM